MTLIDVFKKTTEAALDLSRAIDEAIELSIRRLAPADDPAVEIAWAQGDLIHLTVTLRSGRIIRGRGEAKLEAIVDAEQRRGAADKLGEAIG